MVKCLPNAIPKSNFDQQLQQLASKAQQYPPQSKERQEAISELVNMLERSHRLCRPSKSQFPIVQQIAQDLQQQLLHDVNQELEKYKPQLITIREWANLVRNNALKKVLTDPLLKQIALAAQQAAPLSKERWIALNLLVEALQIADKFCRPYKASFSLEVYEEIYNEALQTTMLEICQKINNYKPTKDVMAWVNFLLENRFKDALNKYMRHGITHMPKKSSQKVICTNDPEIIEKSIWQEQEACFKWQNLRELIEADPDNMFSKEHIKNRPDANFKLIILEKVWGEKTWEEIAETLEISSLQTLSSFYNRCLKKFRDDFLKYLQD